MVGKEIQMNESTTLGNRTRRARSALRQRGLRQIKLWVPDIHGPGFTAELARQVRESEQHDEIDDLEFIEKVADWSE